MDIREQINKDIRYKLGLNLSYRSEKDLVSYIIAREKKAKKDALIETCDKILSELDIEMKCGYCDIFDTIEDKVIEIKQAKE